ncbi:MAG TPA: hypothetical protein VMU16_07125 [Candidatus Binataceae bacterium]|nr:hypothetical protein [Candidatus Binataceae bacterium]
MKRRNRSGLRIAKIAIASAVLSAGCLLGSVAFTGGDSPAGGLVSPELAGSLSPNLLINGDFTEGLNGWRVSTHCFSVDKTTLTPDGKPSLKVDNPISCNPVASLAVNDYVPAPGIYSVDGLIKTEKLGGSNSLPVGARGDFKACATSLIKGSTDWTKVSCKDAVVTPENQSKCRLFLGIYGQASGSAWWGDFALRKNLPPPVKTFLLYPNYRGFFFAGESQEAQMAVTVSPPSDVSRDDVVFQLEAVGESSGKTADHKYPSPGESFTATLDFSGLPAGVYKLTGKLLGKDGKVMFQQSPYRVVKTDAKPGSFLKAWVDKGNLAHFGDGRAHYVIGVYDTTNYYLSPAQYTDVDEIAQAPVNMIINYYITQAPVTAINAYTDALQQHGIFFMPTISVFNHKEDGNYPGGLAASLNATTPDDLMAKYATALASDKGVVGYYVQDEPHSDKVPDAFHQYQIVKANDPSGFDLVVLRPATDAQFWKDAVDVIGIDPYPLWLPTGNDLAQVGDWTRTAVQTVHNARPVWTVIQFFQQTAGSDWPTQQQLHDMSWMAIAEGAAGVFYWSHGMRGLYSVKDPERKKALWNELINVTKEIKEMEPVLTQPDASVLAGPAGSDIVTREKIGPDGARYVIAYNHADWKNGARFELASPAQSVKIKSSTATVQLENEKSFSDNFAPYEAKVYEIR